MEIEELWFDELKAIQKAIAFYLCKHTPKENKIFEIKSSDILVSAYDKVNQTLAEYDDTEVDPLIRLLTEEEIKTDTGWTYAIINVDRLKY